MNSELIEQTLSAKFSDAAAAFERLRTTVYGIISSNLSQLNVNVLTVQSRVKKIDSFIEKVRRKKYSKPLDEVTDIVAFRVIVYLSSEVDAIADSMRSAFEIDEVNSVDKRNDKSVDQVGYRSLHLICKLGSRRNTLPEYKDLCEQRFEIQIRSALEHSWAEIEHVHNYKSNSIASLPTELQRRLMIVAGSLELLDRELSNISAEAREYATLVGKRHSSTDKDKISELSVRSMIQSALTERTADVLLSHIDQHGDVVVSELVNFGLATNSDLHKIIQRFPFDKLPSGYETTTIGFARDLMIVTDPEKYLKKCYKGQFGFNDDDVDLVQRLTGINFRKMLNDYGIEVEPIYY